MVGHSFPPARASESLRRGRAPCPSSGWPLQLESGPGTRAGRQGAGGRHEATSLPADDQDTTTNGRRAAGMCVPGQARGSPQDGAPAAAEPIPPPGPQASTRGKPGVRRGRTAWGHGKEGTGPLSSPARATARAEGEEGGQRPAADAVAAYPGSLPGQHAHDRRRLVPGPPRVRRASRYATEVRNLPGTGAPSPTPQRQEGSRAPSLERDIRAWATRTSGLRGHGARETPRGRWAAGGKGVTALTTSPSQHAYAPPKGRRTRIRATICGVREPERARRAHGAGGKRRGHRPPRGRGAASAPCRQRAHEGIG